MSDQAWIRFRDDGDAAAFQNVVAAHQGLVYGACRQVLGDGPDAEDAAQETFVKLARHARSVRGALSGWLYACARRTALNALASAQARRRREQQVQPAGDAPEAGDAIADAEVRQVVAACVAALPAAERDVVVRYYVLGHTQQAIGRDLGISQVAVFKRLGKAVRRLRALADRRGVAVGALLLGMLGGLAAAAPPRLALRLAALAPSAPAAGTLVAVATAVAALAAAALVAIAAWAVGGRATASPPALATTVAPAPRPPAAPEAATPLARPAKPDAPLAVAGRMAWTPAIATGTPSLPPAVVEAVTLRSLLPAEDAVDPWRLIRLTAEWKSVEIDGRSSQVFTLANPRIGDPAAAQRLLPAEGADGVVLHARLRVLRLDCPFAGVRLVVDGDRRQGINQAAMRLIELGAAGNRQPVGQWQSLRLAAERSGDGFACTLTVDGGAPERWALGAPRLTTVALVTVSTTVEIAELGMVAR